MLKAPTAYAFRPAAANKSRFVTSVIFHRDVIFVSEGINDLHVSNSIGHISLE
jgi:hypothetical protein